MRDRMRTKSYDTLEKEAIAESLGISLNKYKYIERRIAESDNPNDTVENWLKEGKIRLRKTKEEVKEVEVKEVKEEKAKKSDTEDKKDKEADTDSDTNTESNDETKDSIVNDDVEIKDAEIKEEKASKSTKSISTINTNKHICDRCHSKIKDSEYNLNLSYLINGLAGYRFKIDSSRVKLCHDCAIELGKVVEGWLIDNGNGVKVKPWMGDDDKEDKEEDKDKDKVINEFDDFNF